MINRRGILTFISWIKTYMCGLLIILYEIYSLCYIIVYDINKSTCCRVFFFLCRGLINKKYPMSTLMSLNVEVISLGLIKPIHQKGKLNLCKNRNEAKELVLLNWSITCGLFWFFFPDKNRNVLLKNFCIKCCERVSQIYSFECFPYSLEIYFYFAKKYISRNFI